MNTPNPLVPQGTTPAGSKSTVRNAVLTIVVVHVAFIGSLLFWGCSKDKEKPSDTPISSLNSTDTAPVYPMETNASAIGTTAAVPTTGSMAAPVTSNTTSAAPMTPVATPTTPITPIATTPTAVSSMIPTAPAAAPAAGSEYVIAKGDRLADVAKHNHVTLKALMEANPGVDAKKLKVGQKIQIPAATAAAPAAAVSTTGAPADATASAVPSESSSYTVKAGDSLVRIAKNHHTTVKAIVALNGLKSQNNLKVGQKLKMPAPKAAAATATPAPVEATPSASAAGAAPAVMPLTPAPRAATTVN